MSKLECWVVELVERAPVEQRLEVLIAAHPGLRSGLIFFQIKATSAQ